MKSKLEEEKWKKFLKAVRLFRFVPFTDFVMASGSLVTNTLRESSDFDVLIGVRQGRLFINRFFAVLVFSLTGNFKMDMHEKGLAKDMICLNHFITPQSYKLQPPYTEYDKDIYSRLVLVLGNEDKAKSFFKANDWLDRPRIYNRDDHYLGNPRSSTRRLIEFILKGRLGDILEKLKPIQARRIQYNLPSPLPKGARFVCNDNELRFHINSAKTIAKWHERKGS